MPIRTVPNTDQTYYLLIHDEQGRERAEPDHTMLSQTLLDTVKNEPVTDLFIMSHGWRGDIPAAVDQYDRWIANLMSQQSDVTRFRDAHPNFQPLLIGLHWPSEPWGDEQVGAFSVTDDAIENLVNDFAQRLGETPEVRDELDKVIRSYAINDEPQSLSREVVQAYQRLNTLLSLSEQGAGSPPGDDLPPFDPEDIYQAARQEDTEASSFGFLDTVIGNVLAPLRVLSFYQMQKRARLFGEMGAHNLLVSIRATKPSVRVHLMGHSFGCVVVSAMTAGPQGSPAHASLVHSMVLVQGALSLWSYADSIPVDQVQHGYFRRVLAEELVGGPIVTTQSEFDGAVGRFYPIAAGLRHQLAFGGFPKYGGVGSFGLQGLPDSLVSGLLMRSVSEDYEFEAGKVYNLESSRIIKQMSGLSGAHSDIAHAEVAHAIWAAAR